MKNITIGVIGSGAWGTALANCLSHNNKIVTIWCRREEIARDINNNKRNSNSLPQIMLHEELVATCNLVDVANCDIVLLAVPTQYIRDIAKLLSYKLSEKTPVVLCSKGIERKTLCLPSDVIKEFLPSSPIAVLSGPTFAMEVAMGLHSAVTLACEKENISKLLIEALHCRNIRPYISNDIIGVQIGGALKNIIAIACGVLDGLNQGENSKAAIVSRGLTEMIRLAEALGGKKYTLMGLSGLGDLVLTCNSMQSRNFSLGKNIAGGKKIQQYLSSKNSVAEGAYTAAAAINLSKKNNLQLPIIEAVHSLIEGKSSLENIILDLVNRPIKNESDWEN
tara:strand:- start:95 stop:1102 length:1008 start_codon:yes stop_codon:yes gene_type:complete